MALALSAFLVASPALSCGSVLDVECNLTHGGLSPENIGNQTGIVIQQGSNTLQKAGQDVSNALNELQANLLTGPVLEQAIQSSRDTAINGSMPIPPQIRRNLTGYASEESMNQVRYKVGDNGFVNLARLLEQGGAAAAVTLIDVVVFRGESDAEDEALWAHELTHVDQYRNWGVRSFAVHYARNANSVEDEAYAKGNGYLAWAQRSGPAPTPMPAPILVRNPPGLPSGTVMQACGCYGPTTGFNPDARCASGGIMATACQGFCPGGGVPYGWVCQ
ncbi:hypothetical protein BLL42_27345 (plasmid) [Pseudomonas frederiksbergensis]|uniref:eCIS core domain-containing protein n=2 Tax=Pseudomonas frederiksbergensis TaxID=104087 RepID=A0A1J0ETG4_9PSED|nr:hypothetical protein BLL42_27345 [Pseudomonas frederiksbergensis]